MMQVEGEYQKIKGRFSLQEAKFVYLKIAKESEFYLGMQVPIVYITEELSDINYLMVMKPTSFFIVSAN